jgi:hypothetical protein
MVTVAHADAREPRLVVRHATCFLALPMWIVLGNKTKAQRVPDGRVVTCHCRPCGRPTSHVEHEVRDQVSAFFVDLFTMTQRRMICVECHEDLEPEEAFARARRRSP